MAANNLRVLGGGLGVREFPTEANIKLGVVAGDAMKVAGTGTNYADLVLDGDPEAGTDIFVGITTTDSTNTAAADGVVNIEIVGPGTIVEGKATTVANIDTATKLKAIIFDYVAFDRSAATAAGIITIDEDEGTDPNVHGLFIIDGDIVKGTLNVFCAAATIWGSTV